jgi:transposase InsO family protein
VLTSAQETVVVHLRRTLLLPLDDLLAVTREFICPMSLARGWTDACAAMARATSTPSSPGTPSEPHKAFKSYEPGYVHMDVKYLPQMQDEAQRRYLFVAIDRATRWVFVPSRPTRQQPVPGPFSCPAQGLPDQDHKLLTDNGKEFTDRCLPAGSAPSGNHEFDQLCQELGIEHRLTKPRTPRTNGMVERFNGRIADVLKTHRFNSREDMEQTSAALCGPVQPPVAAVSAQEQDADAGHERVVSDRTRICFTSDHRDATHSRRLLPGGRHRKPATRLPASRAAGRGRRHPHRPGR